MSTKLPTNSVPFRLAGPEAVTPERSLAFFRENRDFFARWDPPRPPVFYTPERQRRYLLEEAAENAAGTALYWYLCRPGEKEILGYLHLTGVEQGPPGPTAELGYKLARSAAGQGLMTAAVRQLLAEGRGRLHGGQRGGNALSAEPGAFSLTNPLRSDRIVGRRDRHEADAKGGVCMLSVHIKGLRKKVFSRLAPEIAKTVSELIRAPGEPVLVSRDAAVFYEDGAPRRDMVLVELRWRTRPQEMLELAERLRVLLQDAAGCGEVAVSFGQWQPEELYTFHAEESALDE